MVLQKLLRRRTVTTGPSRKNALRAPQVERVFAHSTYSFQSSVDE